MYRRMACFGFLLQFRSSASTVHFSSVLARMLSPSAAQAPMLSPSADQPPSIMSSVSPVPTGSHSKSLLVSEKLTVQPFTRNVFTSLNPQFHSWTLLSPVNPLHGCVAHVSSLMCHHQTLLSQLTSQSFYSKRSSKPNQKSMRKKSMKGFIHCLQPDCNETRDYPFGMKMHYEHEHTDILKSKPNFTCDRCQNVFLSEEELNVHPCRLRGKNRKEISDEAIADYKKMIAMRDEYKIAKSRHFFPNQVLPVKDDDSASGDE